MSKENPLKKSADKSSTTATPTSPVVSRKFGGFFGIFKRKNPEETPTTNDNSSTTIQSKNDEFRNRMKQDLPPEAYKAFKSSGLKENDVVGNWEIFLNCLYYSNKNLRPKLKEAYRQLKKEKAKLRNELVRDRSVSTSSYSSTFSFSSTATGSSALSQMTNLSQSSNIMTPLHTSLQSLNSSNPTQMVEMIEEKLNADCDSGQSEASDNEEIKIKVSDGKLEEPLPSGLQTPMIIEINEGEPPKLTKTEKKTKKPPKKTYTMEDIAVLATNANPKERYQNFHEIGRGSYGKVYIATEKSSKRQVAIKHMNRMVEEDIDGIANEISLMKSCFHPNIVNYIDSYLYSNQIWIAMEFCDAGTLKQLLVIEMHEDQIAYIVQQLLQGIAYLHSLKRIHRDIKSSNVLLNMNGEVKVADLGLAIEGEGEQTGMAGSKYWMAPEMVKRIAYNTKVDIWSIGALCMEMAEGSPPYYSCKPLKALFLTATIGAPSLKKPDRWSDSFKDFLKECFQMDPLVRPSAEDLLKHAFFNRVCEKSEIIKALKLVF